MKMITKQVMLCTFGTMLEWYDFSLFISLAPIISAIFFPHKNQFAAMLSVFVVFASGFITRPVGAIFFGHLADKVGRKSTMLITILMMAITTAGIGCIPYINNLSIIFLVICRLAQGFAVSGEYPSGLTLLTEQKNSKFKGFISSFGIFATIAGISLGSFVCATTTKLVGHANMLQWGWRIPFLLGAPIGLLGYWIRKSLQESEEFSAIKIAGKVSPIPLLQIVKKYRKEFLTVFSFYMLSNVTFYVYYIYFITYAMSVHKVNLSNTLYVNTLTVCVHGAMLLLFGLLSDFVGRKYLMITACVLFMLFTYPLFTLILTGNLAEQIFSQGCFTIINAMFVGPLAALSAEYFPTYVRASGMGVALNLSASIFGGTAPLVCAWLTKVFDNTAASSFYIIFATLVVSVIVLAPYRLLLRNSVLIPNK